MSVEDFIAIVAAMRHAQKEYFRTRSASSLDEAKRLERQVDAWLLRDKDKQQTLGF